jgi:putative flippase GtrA
VLNGRLRGTWRLLAKEASAFGIVGIACFLLDIGLFQLCYDVIGTGAVTAKLLSTLISMTVAYFAHRHWSFSHRARTGVRREYVLFAVINGAALLLGMAVVAFVRYPLGQENGLILQTANVMSIVLSTVLRYHTYRTWVFPAHDPAADDQPVSDLASARALVARSVPFPARDERSSGTPLRYGP